MHDYATDLSALPNLRPPERRPNLDLGGHGRRIGAAIAKIRAGAPHGPYRAAYRALIAPYAVSHRRGDQQRSPAPEARCHRARPEQRLAVIMEDLVCHDPPNLP